MDHDAALSNVNQETDHNPKKCEIDAFHNDK